METISLLQAVAYAERSARLMVIPDGCSATAFDMKLPTTREGMLLYAEVWLGLDVNMLSSMEENNLREVIISTSDIHL